MNILVLGKGGRELALAWMMSRSPMINRIYCEPESKGMAQYAECVDIDLDNIPALQSFVIERKVDTTIVALETALADSIVAAFREEEFGILNSTEADDLLEGRGYWFEYFRLMYQMPSITKEIITGFDHAKVYLNKIKYPAVLKPVGLAGGMAVKLCDNYISALLHLEDIFPNNKYGPTPIKEVVVIN